MKGIINFPLMLIIPTKKQGYTLIEILLVTALMVLIFTAIAEVLFIGMKVFFIGNTKGNMQGIALSAFSRLSRELMESDIRSMSVIKDDPNYPIIIGFLSAVEINGTELKHNAYTGRMDWQKYIVYYLSDDPSPDYKYNILIRREYNPEDPCTPPVSGYEYDLLRTEQMVKEDLSNLCNGSISDEKNSVVAHEIYELDAELPADYVKERFITLTITLYSKPMNSESPETMDYITRVYFRN